MNIYMNLLLDLHWRAAQGHIHMRPLHVMTSCKRKHPKGYTPLVKTSFEIYEKNRGRRYRFPVHR